MFLFRFNKLYNITVYYLDDSRSCFEVKSKTMGSKLIDLVCSSFNVDEKDYFGLHFVDYSGNFSWLDAEKSLGRQLRHLKEKNLYFRVKFYLSDPSILTNEYTRYLFALQIGIDVRQGLIHGTDSEIAILYAYILQADLGDYNEEIVKNIDFPDTLPNCNKNMIELCLESYKLCKGMLKAETDFKLLDKARALDSYGKRFFKCYGSGGLILSICCDHSGVSVYEELRLLVNHMWAEIYSVTFKGRCFVVVCSGKNGRPEKYLFDNSRQCKAYWRIAWEKFSFYKDFVQEKFKRVGSSGYFSRGSRFRYSGRTLSFMRRHESMGAFPFDRIHPIRVSFQRLPNGRFKKSSIKKELLDVDHVEWGDSGWSIAMEKKEEIEVNHMSSHHSDKSSVDTVPIKDTEETPNPPMSESPSEASLKQPTLGGTNKSDSAKSLKTEITRTRLTRMSMKRLSRVVGSPLPPIYEIIYSLHLCEFVYVKEMRVMAYVFKEWMENVLSDSLLHEFTCLFVPIHQLHERLLPLLTENLDRSHSCQLVNCASAFFSTIFKSLNIYSDYFASVREVVNIFMDSLSSNDNFASTCGRLGRELYIPLARLFLRPSQQLYHYRLVLRDILETCPFDESLFQSFSGRLDLLIDKYEDHIRDILDSFIINECLNSVNGLADLLGNILVRMGVLLVDLSPHLVLLFDHVIALCRPSGNMFVVKQQVWLLHPAKLIDCGGNQFSVSSGDLLVVFTAKSESEKEEWVKDIGAFLAQDMSLIDVYYLQNELSRKVHRVDPSLVSNDLISTCWKFKVSSLSPNDLFLVFKTTFSEFVSRQTKTSNQRFLVVLNNSCLYFFTDYFSDNNLILPQCKQRLSILTAQTAVLNDPDGRFKFKIKMENMGTILFVETDYLQRRWVASLGSASL